MAALNLTRFRAPYNVPLIENAKRLACLSQAGGLRIAIKDGEMPERPKGHDWKSCVPTKIGTEGSNPSLSATLR